MARARNIKPGFFSNDELAEVSPLGRLLFIALWTMADRAGRLEDRPKRIKVEALPYDDCDAESLLSELAERDFILRYARGGRRYIQIVNFSKHQNPHVREPESDIPGPDEPGGPQGDLPDERPPSSSGGHSASTGPTPGEPDPGPADSGFLIPDSPSRIPDSGGESRPPDGERTPRACRIPENFPDDEWIAWAAKERPDLDARLVADKFRDYWLGVPGAKGRKLDWPATWRNFVRNEYPRRGASNAPPQPKPKYADTIAALTGRNRQPEPETIDVHARELAAPRLD